MKHQPRRFKMGLALLPALFLLASCGTKQTVASKSAAAIPGVEKKNTHLSGDAHASHRAGGETTQSPTQIEAPQDMTGMDHSKMDMAGMDHGAPTANDVPISPPTSSSEVRSIQPSVTLRADSFDSPVPISVAEAMKKPGEGGHEGHGGVAGTATDPGVRAAASSSGFDHSQHGVHVPATRKSPESGRVRRAPTRSLRTVSPPVNNRPRQKVKPAQPRSKARVKTTPPRPPVAAAIYACPMHPEVTNHKPGTCHKCGMALVKKK